MAILVIGGSASKVGKTTLICSVIRKMPEFRWTAVKISAHSHRDDTIWEESLPGEETDTARFLAAGAHRAILVTVREGEFPIEAIRAALAADVNVIFESNRIADYVQPDVALAIIGPHDGMKSSFLSFLRRADAIVVPTDRDLVLSSLPDLPVFRLGDFEGIPPNLIAWLQDRIKSQTGFR